MNKGVNEVHSRPGLEACRAEMSGAGSKAQWEEKALELYIANKGAAGSPPQAAL